MLTVGSVFLTLCEIICNSLSITIVTYRFCNNRSIKKFIAYLFLITLVYFMCFLIHPPLCLIACIFAIAALIRIESKDLLLGFYISALSVSVVLYVHIIDTVLFQILYPFQYFITAYPFMFSILNLIICVIFSLLFSRKTISFKSRHNMLLLGIYNTLSLAIYLVVLPMILSFEDYANLSIVFILIIFVFMSSVVNIGLAFIINRNEAQKAFEESEQKLMDIKHKFAIKDYNEAIIFKHAFAVRYNSLSYYIQKEDFQGLKEYFNKYIQPMHSAHMTNEKILAELEKMSDEVIRNCIFTLFEKCCLYGIKIRLFIFSNTEKVGTVTDISLTDFMAIMDIFSEIAYIEARDLEGAEILVSISQTEQTIKLTFENTYGNMSNEINLKAYQMPLDEKNYRDELLIIDEFNNKYKNVIFRTMKQNNSLLQEIIIDRRNLDW